MRKVFPSDKPDNFADKPDSFEQERGHENMSSCPKRSPDSALGGERDNLNILKRKKDEFERLREKSGRLYTIVLSAYFTCLVRWLFPAIIFKERV